MGSSCSCKRKKSAVTLEQEKCLAEDERLLFEGIQSPAEQEDQVESRPVDTLEAFRDAFHEEDFEHMEEEDREALEAKIEDYNFPFENLVFEGGGVKGLGYIGALKCLDEYGIYKQIRRFAGTSAGAIAAGMIALGYHYEELADFWSGDVDSLFSAKATQKDRHSS